MPSKPPIVFPNEQRLLTELGQRLRLARLRRELSMETVAGRARISRSSLYNVESGDPGATMGTYLRVMAVLGLEKDLGKMAVDDVVGRKLQDLGLEPSANSRAPRRARKSPGTDSTRGGA